MEFSLLSEPEAARWCARRAKGLGCAMDGDAAEKLVFMVGRALTGLDAELQKNDALLDEAAHSADGCAHSEADGKSL